MVEAFYHHQHEYYHETIDEPFFRVKYPSEIKPLLCDDVFRVGLDPATILRKCDILFNLDQLMLPADGVNDKTVQQSLKHLLRIRKKKDFELNVELSQKHIRFSIWKAWWAMLQPILLAFEREGAIVRISWCHRNLGIWHPPHVRLELNHWLQDGPQLDEDALIEFLDDEYAIQDVYRDYLTEGDPDYEPYDSADEMEHGVGLRLSNLHRYGRVYV